MNHDSAASKDDDDSRPEQLPSLSSNNVTDTSDIEMKQNIKHDGDDDDDDEIISVAKETSFGRAPSMANVAFSIKQTTRKSIAGGALLRMHKALTLERRNSKSKFNLSGVKANDACLRVYSWDEVIVDDKIDPKLYDFVFVFPANGSSMNEFYASEVAPFEGARHHDNKKKRRSNHKQPGEETWSSAMIAEHSINDLENNFQDAKIWGAERYAEFFLGVVTETIEDDILDEDDEDDFSTENYSTESKAAGEHRAGEDTIGINTNSVENLQQKRDSISESVVSHLISMVKSRITVDAAKIVFQTASSLTCNLTNKMILAREMESFNSRGNTVQRMRLKLVAVNAFVDILKRIRYRDRIRQKAVEEIAKRQQTRTKKKSSFGAMAGKGINFLQRKNTSEDNKDDHSEETQIKLLSSLSSKKLEKMRYFNPDDYIDLEMLEYKEKIRNYVAELKNKGQEVLIEPLHKSSSSFLQKSKSALHQIQHSTMKKGRAKRLKRSKSFIAREKWKNTKQIFCCGLNCGFLSGKTPGYWDNPKPLQFVGEAPYALASLLMVLGSIIYTMYELFKDYNASDIAQSQDLEKVVDTSVNIVFVVLFTIDILLRLIHEGCHDFWFDMLSVVDILVVAFDWFVIIFVSTSKVLGMINILRLFKGLRLLRILRIARSSRSAIALQNDVKRQLVYRDLFALNLLENEFQAMAENLAMTFPEWKTLSEKAKYDIIVIQTIALRLKHTCHFDVTLVHRDGRVYALVGHGESDLMAEAERTQYTLQLHNYPFSQERKYKIRQHSLPREKLFSSLDASANFLRRKIQNEVKGESIRKESAVSDPTKRQSIMLSPEEVSKLSEGLNDEARASFDSSKRVEKTKRRTSRGISTASIFKNEFSLDPNIALHTEIYPYNKIVAGLKSIGHKPFQTLKAGEDVDSLAAVYYSPHTPFINKSHTRGLYRTYKYDEGTKRIGSSTHRSKRRTKSKRISLFRSVDRERLMLSLMNKHLNMPWIRKTVVKDTYWLHRENVHELEENLYNSKMITSTVNVVSTREVLHGLRNYYGEAVALNYAMTWQLGEQMKVPGILGLIVWIILWSTANTSLHRWIRITYTIFILFWGRWFRNNWKRQNAELNLLWGANSEDKPERPRVEFKGVLLPDPVTDELKLYRQNSWAQKVAYVVSWSTTFFLGTISILLFFLVLYAREYCYHCIFQPTTDMGQLLTRGLGSLLFGLQIILSEVIFKKVALLLTEYENHRRTSIHRAHFVAKAFIFSLINNFSSAIYMTYFDSSIGSDIFFMRDKSWCNVTNFPDTYKMNSVASNFTTPSSQPVRSSFATHYSSPMGEKAFNLFLLFLSQIVLGNIIEFFLPVVEISCMKRKPCHDINAFICCCGKHHEDEKSETSNQGTHSEKHDELCEEKTRTSLTGKRTVKNIFTPLLDQAYLVEYDFIEEYDNLSDLIVSYTFATAFATLFPLGATLAMAAFALELRLDLYQQCRHYRRPYPETANRLEAAELLLGYTETFAWFNNGMLLVLLEFGGLDENTRTADLTVMMSVLVTAATCYLFSNAMIWVLGSVDHTVATLASRFRYRATKVMAGAKEREEEVHLIAKKSSSHNGRKNYKQKRSSIGREKGSAMGIFISDNLLRAKSVNSPTGVPGVGSRLKRDFSTEEFYSKVKNKFQPTDDSEESDSDNDEKVTQLDKSTLEKVSTEGNAKNSSRTRKPHRGLESKNSTQEFLQAAREKYTYNTQISNTLMQEEEEEDI